jgi:hypothetical protein
VLAVRSVHWMDTWSIIAPASLIPSGRSAHSRQDRADPLRLGIREQSHV